MVGDGEAVRVVVKVPEGVRVGERVEEDVTEEVTKGCTEAMSLPVKIATTPGILLAAAMSTDRMRACAWGERRNTA